MKQKRIETAAVLGSGVMGSGIAALLAGAGVKTYLLDIVAKDLKPGENRSKIAQANLQAAIKANPAAFYTQGDTQLVTAGNFEDHLDKLSTCDWVIEVVIENLAIKQQLIEKVAKIVPAHAIVTSNTSGIDIDAIAANTPDSFKKRWLGTHFFNPPRYMKLLEIIPGKHTDQAVIDQIVKFGTDALGKGIIYAKNTPNFIANRVGVYTMIYTVNEMINQGLSIVDVDAILGKALGRPKTAVFKTADMVGIDTLNHVAKNLHAAVPNDPYRDDFKVPAFIDAMVQNGALGQKSKGGFYKKVKGERKVIDWKTGEYIDVTKPKFESLQAAKNIDELAPRIKKIVMEGQDAAAIFAWKTIAMTLMYSAAFIPEIADRIVEIDRGMKWGYNWELGPFEIWDALGVEATAKRMEKEGITVPASVKKMLASGATSFYQEKNDGIYYYDLVHGGYKKLEEDQKSIWIPNLVKANKVIEKNSSASLIDAGDGVLLVQFHSKMNAVDAEMVEMLNTAVDKAENDGWQGVVIGNHDSAFSAGANLMLVFMNSQGQQWTEVENMVRGFQAVNMRMKYSDVPVVAAVGGLALGGGCEIAMHAAAQVLAGEAYVGLVEVGVGLIPAGGGCKEYIAKLNQGIADGLQVTPLSIAQTAFTHIATADVAKSGKEAIRYGFFNRSQAEVNLNREHIIYDAKQKVLALRQAGYQKPQRLPLTLGGQGVYGALLVGLDDFLRAGYATEYDVVVGKKLAKVLTGGIIPEGTQVDEQFVLDLECEAFLSLCGEERTMARIQHMLMNNKPLRN